MRPEAHDEEPGHERWLVSYADFITLMFAFFAVLYATSQKDVEKSQKFEESIKKFLVKAGGGTTIGASVGQAPAPQATAIDAPIETFRKSKPEAASVQDEADQFIESRLSNAERREFVLDVATDDLGLRISLKGSALYDHGSDKFRASAVPFVAKLSGLLAETKRKVVFEGHVLGDELGEYHSTWEFAGARATNLLRFVQTKDRIPSERLAMASLADSRPVYQGERAALNSRVDVLILNSDIDL